MNTYEHQQLLQILKNFESLFGRLSRNVEELNARLNTVEQYLDDSEIQCCDDQCCVNDDWYDECCDDCCDDELCCNLSDLTFEDPLFTRQESIDLAYADLEDICENNQYDDEGKLIYHPKQDFVEFHINQAKNTVVALLHKGSRTGKVTHRAKAKCLPTDKFNAYIGASIALHRLFGFPVPKYLYDVPNN